MNPVRFRLARTCRGATIGAVLTAAFAAHGYAQTPAVPSPMPVTAAVPVTAAMPVTAAVPVTAAARPQAAGSVTLKQMLLLDNELALKNLQDKLSGSTPSGAPANDPGARAADGQAAVNAEVRSHRHPPFLTAAYGPVIDGVSHMQGVINWDDIETPISVGSRIRGYAVTSITAKGATLVSGRRHLFAPLELDGTTGSIAAVSAFANSVPGLSAGTTIGHSAVPSYMPQPVVVPVSAFTNSEPATRGATLALH